MNHYFEALGISLVIAFITTMFFYEILCMVMKVITQREMTPRRLLIVLVLGILVAHSISVLLYGFACWALVKFLNYPPLEGIDSQAFSSYLYYSATCYSSLGVGDVYARGSLRLITSFEVINGLTLIAWSATFTYFAVQKMWEASGLPLHINCECCGKKK